LVVSPAVVGAPVPVPASAGAVVLEAESVAIVLLDSVVAGVVVVSVVLVSVAGFDSHEVRPTARKRAAADTFSRLFILG
jgi:hypothetical protein